MKGNSCTVTIPSGEKLESVEYSGVVRLDFREGNISYEKYIKKSEGLNSVNDKCLVMDVDGKYTYVNMENVRNAQPLNRVVYTTVDKNGKEFKHTCYVERDVVVSFISEEEVA